MRERLAMPEPAAFVKRLLDVGVRVEDLLAREQLHVLEKLPARSDRRVDVEPVLHARQEVVRAMARRRVDGTGALVERDVVREHGYRIALIQRMPEPEPLERLAFHPRQRSVERTLDVLPDRSGQSFGDDHDAAVDVVGRVVELRMECDREVRRNRPRRRRPDQHGDLSSGERGTRCARSAALAGGERELDVDRRRRVVGVLDLRFCERRAAVDAPVDRLLALVERGRARRTCPARARCPPDSAGSSSRRSASQSPKTRSRLNSSVMMSMNWSATRDRRGGCRRSTCRVSSARARDRLSVRSAGRGSRSRGYTGRRSRPSYFDLTTRSLSVLLSAVPRWMWPLAYGRPVVQDELRRAAAFRANPAVQVHRLPPGDRFRLGRLEVGLHRKTCTRQVYRLFPLGHKPQWYRCDPPTPVAPAAS